MVARRNESKTLAKDISCECKCKFDGGKYIQIDGRIMINVMVSVKNIIYVKKILWNIFLENI